VIVGLLTPGTDEGVQIASTTDNRLSIVGSVRTMRGRTYAPADASTVHTRALSHDHCDFLSQRSPK
jgi:hypothetical protein